MRILLPLALAAIAPAAYSAAEEATSVATAPADEVAALVRDLSDPSYEIRTKATRRLCMLGPAAAEALRGVASGDNAEAALRARRILAVLDEVYFAGVEVTLAFSATQVGWDTPVDLRLTLSNRSTYPARVPFVLDAARRGPAESDAAQVADMLDLAEWLQVRGPSGREIVLRVDDIAADPAVTDVVQQRLNNPPDSVLPPGKEAVLVAKAFNRGWARYPLLDAGEYIATLVYEPEWDDETLAAQRIGSVSSKPAKITVGEAAPAAVSRGGDEAALTVQREGADLVARLTNRSDQPVYVNRNLGPAAPFAPAAWVYTLAESVHEVPAGGNPATDWRDFDEALFTEVGPGQTLEVARTGIARLRATLDRAGANLASDRWTVHLSYTNRCDRQWQARDGAALLGKEDAPRVFQMPLPKRILSGRHLSNAVNAPELE
ncbi:MAG: hypothetical protein HY763_02940 [Planctomycetes bacterium]|nr:hypothetical protein [Planctomycetota bacterium]